ncbi:helix-turn-helix transcriptional regulator [Echinicola marina]|uniref:helix-turn-helix transcriptional regulator n=1 Tax=Echinicola marina TaxID=2859768 RepID=UPI001CF6CB82|nr:helix-turn-helix transcriptional regulator [Echinicola marina]UCS91945.1 helix-turn-helix transcriptional regulator [Echinicola marina]
MSQLEKDIRDMAAKAPRSNWKEKVEYRRANKKWLKKSSEIALRVLDALDDKGWRKADLARKLEVSPQQVGKIVKGQENFTLETLSKLEDVLGITLITVLQEDEIVMKRKDVAYRYHTAIKVSGNLNMDDNFVYQQQRKSKSEECDLISAA